jgi:hypothetical protein
LLRLVEVLLDTGLTGFADGNDADDGCNADANAEHRQEAAQLVA